MNSTARPFTFSRAVAALSRPDAKSEFVVKVGGVELWSAPTFEAAKSLAGGFKKVEIVERKIA